jgi:SAM domain (Sterile alpha motif)
MELPQYLEAFKGASIDGMLLVNYVSESHLEEMIGTYSTVQCSAVLCLVWYGMVWFGTAVSNVRVVVGSKAPSSLLISLSLSSSLILLHLPFAEFDVHPCLIMEIIFLMRIHSILYFTL